MERRDLIRDRVHTYYWRDELNCAVTTLKILSEYFGIDIHPQVMQSAIGLHGAGFYGAQCGLVEGGLMCIGIMGALVPRSDEEIVDACYDYAARFERHFGSLLCRELRPEGFSPDNPPHLCEDITNRAVLFTLEYIEERVTLPEQGRQERG